jgi:hypothetical protein
MFSFANDHIGAEFRCPYDIRHALPQAALLVGWQGFRNMTAETARTTIENRWLGR